MSLCIKTLAVSVTACLMFAAGSIQAKEPVSDSLKPVMTVSDSTLARVVRALNTGDTALLGSLLPEDINLIMPGEIKLESRTKAMKYANLLMQTVGGSDIEFERLWLDFIPKYTNIVRDAGTFILKATDGDEGQKIGINFVGTFTFYWELEGETWLLKRAFIDKKRGQ